MKLFVIDASVAVKWLYKEDHWENAQEYYDSESLFFAPEIIKEELANAIVKKVRFRDVNPVDGWESYNTIFQSNLFK